MGYACPLNHHDTTQLADGRIYCESCDTTTWGTDNAYWTPDQCTEVTGA